ncbi:GNAT family N-acetyltransferase [Wukongibacter baidiensis]|uniref:GNAT family N-acetyltransferase n=1 Tax=Wukongibacter baidiensis TaxID=1723361 RepID=UPI003D7FC852
MIRKLMSTDNAQLMEYLKEEKSINLFIIGDVENFGYDSDFQEIWAEFDENEQIIGVLLRYRNFYIPYSKGEFDIEGFVDTINKNKKLEAMSGKKSVIEKFDKYMEFEKKKEQYFAELIDNSLLDMNIDLIGVKKANIEDVDSINDLKELIEEFDITPSSKESFRQTIETGTGRTYFMKVDGKVVASASTTAENSESAMIVGVCTHPEYRRKGYATKCMTALCNEVLKEGRTLCLFYDNPNAGIIYKSIGFKDIGKWKMYVGRR